MKSEKIKSNNKINGLYAIAIFLVIIPALMAIVGCETVTEPGNPSNNATTQITDYNFDSEKSLEALSFDSEEELVSFIKKYSGSSYGYYGGIGLARSSLAVDDIDVAFNMETEATPMVSKQSAGSEESYDGSDSGNSFSETNNQVQGVDEADIIKTDGEYIYTISGSTLYIVKAYPGEDAETVSEIKFDNSPTSLFVYDKKLAVFGNYYDSDFFDEMGIRPVNGMSYFNIYDLSDIENPELEKEYKFQGRYDDARMIDGFVYFVTLEGMNYRYPIPVYFDGMEKVSVSVDTIHYFPISYDNPRFANIFAINMKNPDDDVDSETIAVEYDTNLYMSENNAYITFTKRISEWDIEREIMMEIMIPRLTTADKTLIEKIRNTDSDVLSEQEKDSKIFQIISEYSEYMSEKERDEIEDLAEEMLEKKLKEYDYFEYTHIHRIKIEDGNIELEADGRVPGQVINQFSMDEHEGVFRITTTISARWSSIDNERTESSNNIFTLDKDLKIMDHVDGIAEGESIYSTRFIGDKLYMVTYRQVDPFFVVDLSDPENIEILGELKIPGFSRYLHPYDENTIIGIGRDATETGRTQGLKISLFDVSDFENPEEIAKFVTDEKYAQSTAEYEHKAFLFSKEKNMLVIPAYSSHWERDEGTINDYNGAMVFHITKDEIELRGIIDHSDGSNYYYGSLVQRSLYIEDLLYTKSENLLRINRIDNLESVGEIEFKNTNTKYPVY